MTVWSNTCEGGANTVDVTAANSGGASGDAFNQVFRGGSSTVKYDSSQAAHGSMSIKCTGAGSFCGPQWTSTTSALAAARFYIRFSVLPTTNVALISFPNASMGISSTGKFNMWNASFAVISTFTVAAGTNIWYRLEMEVQTGTTTSNGYLAGRYFLGDATTPVEAQYSSNVQNTGTGAALTNLLWGYNNNTSAIANIDDMALNNATTTPIGPAAAAGAFAGWGIPQ